MKSEKARQELEDGSWKVEVGYEGEDVDLPYHAVRVDVAQYAVELAEQEAEERMREKAKRAFECVWNATPKQVAEECGISIQEINNEAAAMKYCPSTFVPPEVLRAKSRSKNTGRQRTTLSCVRQYFWLYISLSTRNDLAMI